MTALRFRTPSGAWRAGTRLVLGFAAAAAAAFAVIPVPLVVTTDLSAPPGGASLHSLRFDAEILGWAYLWILGLSVAFGLPTWLVLRRRRWGGAPAYALAGAAAAVVSFGVAHAALHLPNRSTLAIAAWSAAAGALGGAVFQRVVRDRPDRRSGGAAEDIAAMEESI